MEKYYSSGQVCKILNVSQRKLEYWLARIGDVERINNRRIYNMDDVERIKNGIGQANLTGFKH
jgi:DNA-binding transcriptional MerR regulator